MAHIAVISSSVQIEQDEDEWVADSIIIAGHPVSPTQSTSESQKGLYIRFLGDNYEFDDFEDADYISAADDPVLAALWDNDSDSIFDTL